MSSTVEIENKLKRIFDPERLVLMDESARHAGHIDASDSPALSHLRVRIVSAHFEGLTRLERHRAVNEALSQEISDGLHALAIEAAAPGERTRW